MELFFLALLVLLMASALASGYPVAFALPGSAIITIGLAALMGWIFAGDASAFFAQGGPGNWLSAGVTNFRGVYWEVERDTLIAIPLFVFMGIMLQRSMIAEDLLVSMAQLFGSVRGGLGISVVFVGALLAATTGIVGATVVAMGLISLPAMLRNNYSHSLATGTIAASGTLGQIIPPSIVLIILADQLTSAVDQASTARKALFKEATGSFSLPSEFGVTSTSAGDMFMGALVPGLVLVALYMVYILFIAFIRPKVAPVVPFEGNYDRKFAGRVLMSLVPPLALIFVVLGSIITGIATVNQAGAIGAVGALIMAGYRMMDGKKGAFYPALMSVASLVIILFLSSSYTINVRNVRTTEDEVVIALAAIAVAFFVASVFWSGWRAYKINDTLSGVMLETAKTTSLVFIILLGAAMLTAAFRAFGGEVLVKDFLTSLPGGFWVQFIIVMGVIFLLGFFLDFIEIAVVVVPIVAPILLTDPSANVTAVWLGVMIGLNIQTSFLTPPFGFALFYLRGVAPPIVKTLQMYKGVIPFIALQLGALVIVANFPGLVNYLPNRISLTSETAPPPRNPRLQLCIEDYNRQYLIEQGDVIRAAIKEARGWDVSYLPAKQKSLLTQSFDKAEATFGNLEAAFATTVVVEAVMIDYMPLHRQVRTIQGAIKKMDNEIKKLTPLMKRAERLGEDGAKRAADLSQKIDELKATKSELSSTIPQNWKADHGKFIKILNADKKSRAVYRRTADGAYEPIRQLVTKLSKAAELAAFESKMIALTSDLASNSPGEKAISALKQVETAFRKLPDTDNIRKSLSKARRALKKKKPNAETARKELAKAQKLFAAEVSWRNRAAREILTDIERYEAVIRNNIGLRMQSKLPKEIALEVAACNSGHRDISRYF